MKEEAKYLAEISIIRGELLELRDSHKKLKKRNEYLEKKIRTLLNVMKENDLHYNLCQSLYSEDGVCDCYELEEF